MQKDCTKQEAADLLSMVRYLPELLLKMGYVILISLPIKRDTLPYAKPEIIVTIPVEISLVKKYQHFNNKCDIEASITNISIYLSIHKPHQSAAYEKSKPVALHLARIVPTMKAFKYLRQFLRFKSTTCIRYCDKLTAIHFIKANLYSSAVTVFDRIFNQILQTLKI